MALGPVMLDLAGIELQPEEREILQHPAVGGLILFSRNYEAPQQLKALMQQVREVAPEMLVAVDHEGGRVQRFRQGFTELPAMGALFELAGGQLKDAQQLSEACGLIMAAELTAFDIDFSFAPVLDLNGISEVIGDRAFAASAEPVVALAGAFIDGMHRAGMSTTGKHFPGHGSVREDSHIAIPRDNRPATAINTLDLPPFAALIEQGKLDAIMPAHVIYTALDAAPAGFSNYWLQQILRQQLGFDGVIFSDDLTMDGASVIGDYPARTDAALSAGCDMVLVCNNRIAAEQVVDHLGPCSAVRPEKLAGLRLQPRDRHLPVNARDDWQQAQAILSQYLR